MVILGFRLDWIGICLVGILLLPFSRLTAQDYYAPRERVRFANATHRTGQYSTSLQECRLILETFPEASFLDSIRYLAGQNHIRLGDLPGMEAYFFPLSADSENDYYAYSGVALSYRMLQANEFEAAREIAVIRTLFSPEATHLHPFAHLECAASHLLEKNFASFDSVKAHGNFEQYEVKRAMAHLEGARTKYTGTKRKSPFLAATLSTIIPGGGQAYGKRWGNAATYFFFAAVMGVQAWEGYNKEGFRDPQFIVFSTAFLGVYLANIYGSVIHTKRYNAKIETDFRRQVLVEVALPVESLFDRR